MIKRKGLVLLAGLTFWLILTALPISQWGSAEEETYGSYREDFLTTSFLDAENTTADGWGTGVIYSAKKSPTMVDKCVIVGALDVFVAGNYAYVVSEDSEFCVVDISDPMNTVLVATLPTSHETRSVFVSGNYAYITYGYHDTDDGMQVVDITIPTSPALVGGCYIEGHAKDIYIEGNYAYVAGESGLEVIDISDPVTPTQVNRCDTATQAFGVFVSGNYAYVVIREWLHVVDIHDPGSPSLAGSCNIDGITESSLYVEGDYAFIAGYDSSHPEYWGEFYSIDITDPTSPTIAGSCETDINDVGVFMKGVAVEGNYAYVAHGSLSIRDEGMHVIDITDPTNPTLLKSIVTHPLGSAKNVFVEGNYAYLAGKSGLSVVAIGDPVNPTLAGYCNDISFAMNVFIAGDHAYVTGGSDDEFHSVDISDPTNPTIVGQCDSLPYGKSIFLAGDYAYIADKREGLKVLDISDPTAPTLAGICDISHGIYDVHVDGDFAYVTVDGDEGLEVIDVSDPTAPTFVANLPYDLWGWGVFVDGDNVYYGIHNALKVADVSDPTAPVEIGTCHTSLDAEDVFVSGNYAFVTYTGAGWTGLRVIDISDPTNPFNVGFCELGVVEDVYVSGDSAYVTNSWGRLNVVDISDPTNPSLVVICDLDDTSHGVFVEGDYAYVGGGSGGLKVIEVRRNKVRQFESPSYAQSMPIFDAPHPIFSATLNSTATVPEGTSINYFLSADAGLHWESVTLGLEHVFVYSGTQLLWKAEMITTDTITTPEISEIIVDYTIENSLPISNAGPDQVVRREGIPLWVQLDGGLSFDPDGDPIVCLWTMTSRPEGSSAIIADPMSVTPRFVADLRGEYIVELIVSDPWTSSFPDTVTVTRENNRPIISWAYIDFRKRVFGSHLDVGINQLNEIESMTWLECDTYDGDQDSLTHDWSIISKPPGSLAEIPASFDHLTLEMIGIDLPGYYLIQFVVNDGYEDSLPAYVSINVLDTDIFDLHEEGETIITEHDTNGTPGSDVWVTLTEVTEAGDTSVDASPTGPADPSGFELAGVYYDISTDATYDGPVMISINYDDTGLTLEEEQNLRLYHYETVDPGADPPVWDWVNVTVLPVDTDNNIICGQVSSLSWIAVGIQLPEVQVTFPPENTALMDGVTFEAQAVGAGDITEVNFYIRKPGGENGIPIGFESLPATYDSISDRWQYDFDTTELSNGNYVLLANAKDIADKEGWSEMVPFSIRNWAVLELLPNTPNNRAGRTMPVKFALRISDDVDGLQPFAYSEELEIRIYDTQNPDEILQTSTYGEGSKDYRIDMDGELYITNFKTKKNIITTYVVEIWKTSNDFKVGGFTFETVK